MAQKNLIIDDDFDVAETLSLVARLMGHQAKLAFNGPSALEAIRPVSGEKHRSDPHVNLTRTLPYW